MSSSAAQYDLDGGLKHRNKVHSPVHSFASSSPSTRSDEEELEEIISKTSSLQLDSANVSDAYPGRNKRGYGVFVYVISPILFTLVSAFVRLYHIDYSNKVLWDEAHFGKFGSHYLQHEYYFDVHPPLGKLLVAFSGYLAGYDGSFGFESGFEYPENCNYIGMRVFNAVFGILCTPVAYYTSLLCGFNALTTHLITLSVVLEMVSLLLSKFILLDSMLLFFTVTTFYCLVKYHSLRVESMKTSKDALLQPKGWFWLALTGVSVGCVSSVKWVGFFITALVGLYTIYDLYIKHCQAFLEASDPNKISIKRYLSHWISRIITLIIIPFLLYLSFFRIHFGMLYRSGTGDGSISTLLQASFEDHAIANGPRSVGYGSMVSLRTQGLSPHLLHSHSHNYPEGSGQQQVTTYGYKDNNNDFLIEFGLDKGFSAVTETQKYDQLEELEHRNISREERIKNSPELTQLVVNGDVIRLYHQDTGCLLHSHNIASFVSKSYHEVSCYANLANSNSGDEWIVEIQEQQVSPDPFFHNESQHELHPVSTNFRLKHKDLGCYLATTGYTLPKWGFGQGEVVCKYSMVGNDKTTWWNIEDHGNDLLEPPLKKYVAPPPRFWKEFILLNYAMMASNNALVADKDKFDILASEWWQWPTLLIGLRMGAWTTTDVKFFLIGNPAVTWVSVACLVIFVLLTAVSSLLWQRQLTNFPYGRGSSFDEGWNKYLIQGLIPFLAWFMHFFPFIMMGRVTYVHHYVPAQYFATFITGYIVEKSVHRLPKPVQWVTYLALYAAVIGTFVYLRELDFGMVGHSSQFQHLRVLKSWII